MRERKGERESADLASEAAGGGVDTGAVAGAGVRGEATLAFPGAHAPW